MSLDLKDIERGVGADLLRRPLISTLVNACILRLYHEAVVEWPEEEDGESLYNYQNPEHPQDVKPAKHSVVETETEQKSHAPSLETLAKPSTPNDGEIRMQHQTKQTVLEHIIATLLFVVTHIVLLLGMVEALVWLVSSVIFKIFGLPRIYPFEKCLVDIRALFLPQTLRYIEKNFRLSSRDNSRLPEFVAIRRGLSFMPITIITPVESLTRDSVALLRILRYINRVTIGYWTEDAIVLVGRNEDIVQALCNLNEQPMHIDLGWHKDVVERTTYKLSITFTRETSMSPSDFQVSPIRVVGVRVVVVQLHVESTTQNLEMLLNSFDQFAAVCEASERGRRLFNGKRAAIYCVGLSVAFLLIFYYEPENLNKPSVDVLTIAVGAYTLWMTIGKSAALGEVEEVTEYVVPTRENILLAYHGLARIGDNVVNTCWVQEIYRFDRSEPSEEQDMEDGSITVLEAAVYLNIFMHFGHMIKWKGTRLTLDRYNVEEESKDPLGIGHFTAVHRVPNINMLRYEGESGRLERIGGDGRHPCNHFPQI